jgi:hypothetical protein
MAKRKLTEQEEEWVINDTFESIKIEDTLKKINMNRRQFNSYLKDNPEFAMVFAQAEIDACKFIENDMLNIHRKAKDDHKLARVMLEAMRKVLEYRNPAKYSPKMDMNLNGTISVRGAIDNANNKLTELIRDVTPALSMPKK